TRRRWPLAPSPPSGPLSSIPSTGTTSPARPPASPARAQRRHRRIPYDDPFRPLTLPSPRRPAVKITPPGKIHVLHIDYWCPEFPRPRARGTSVKVRYDPDDRGHVEAWVSGQWRGGASQHPPPLQGRAARGGQGAA